MLSDAVRQLNELLDLTQRMLENGQPPTLADQMAFFEKKRDFFELIANQTMPGPRRDEAMQAAAEAAEQVRALRQRLPPEEP